tara:strand:+ start:240 stop:344 length:105 start_codon:yes stop_codon:yes gene_type:complete
MLSGMLLMTRKMRYLGERQSSDGDGDKYDQAQVA